jgi:hypothetical protein
MGFGNRIGVCAGLAEAGIGFVGELNVCGISMLSGNAGADAVRDWLGGCGFRYAVVCDGILFGIMKKVNF